MPYYYPVDYPYQPYQPKTIVDKVQGEVSANIYPVQAGQEVILFDIDNPYVYRKERGLDNKLIQKRFRLVEDTIEETKPAEYMTKEEVSQMISEALEKKTVKKKAEE